MDSSDDGAVDRQASASADQTDQTGDPGVERLVPLDVDDPALADIYVPVPGVAEADSAGVADEARAWARNLLASGGVAGIAATVTSYGPPHRPTHELVEDAQGRRVLRRVGFSAG